MCSGELGTYMRRLAFQTTDLNTYIYIITSEFIKLREYDASFYWRLMFAIVASVRWCWLSRSSSWWGSWKSFENPRISLGRIRLEVLLSGIYVDLLLSVGRTNPAGEQKHLDYIIFCYAGSSLHGILESTDRLAKKIRRFLKNNLPIFKLVFADFRMTQNYVYTKFKDWVLKKSRNQEFHFSLGISRLFFWKVEIRWQLATKHLPLQP